MAQLGSPGVQVNVIDESFYNPAQPGTIPLVVLATSQDKQNASGTGIAPGTTAANANSLYLATSQKDLTDRFGTPVFQKDASGNAIQGSELNEYGLFAAYSYLGASNSAYILRANVDLNALTGLANAPVGNPESDSYWVDTSKTRFGIFEWSEGTQQFVNKVPLVLNSASDVVAGTYTPKASVGAVGDYAVVTYSRVSPEITNDANTVWYKNSANTWVKVGSQGGTYAPNADWTSSWPAITSKSLTTPVSISETIYGQVSGVSATTVTGVGVDAKFVVTKTGSTYAVVPFLATGRTTTGTGYVAGDTIKIAGNLLGGATPANDITIVLGNDIIDEAPGTLEGCINASTLATSQLTLNTGNPSSSYAMTITIGSFDRTTSYTPIQFALNGGLSGSEGNANATVTEIAAQINAAIPSNVPVGVRVNSDNRLEFIANANVYITLTDPGSTGLLAASNASAEDTAASPLGIKAGTYNAPSVDFAAHTKVPFWSTGDTDSGTGYVTTRPTGSVWFKTTEFNLGAKWFVKRFNGDTKIFETKDALVFKGTDAALYGLDPLGGGINIAANTLFVDANYQSNDDANFRIKYRANTGATTTTLTVPANFSSANETVTIIETLKGVAEPKFISFDTNGATMTEFVEQITDVANYASGTAMVNVKVDWNETTRQLTLTHLLGGEIGLIGSSWGTAGIADAVNTAVGPVGVDYVVSNWKPLSTKGYVVGATQPTDTPADGTLWYASYQNQVDIMIHDGTGWKGYKNVVSGVNPTGPFVQATKPTKQSDDTALVEGDLWIDTSDQDNYGKVIKRWNDRSKTWDAITTTDHTSQYGIIYADARWATTGASATASSIVDLMSSNYLDFDAPDPTAYPRGMLLWNTRRSGFNIKQYKKNYVDTSAKNPRQDDVAMSGYYADRWVSVSGQDLNQVAYFGRKAQRAYVVGQLKVAINTNQRILDEDNIFFNLIACPGYPELISDMVNLNNSRNGTALVVGDTPLRLASSANTLVNYGTDYYNTGVDGEEGLHTNSDHLAVYYPSGLTTDLSGTNVVVPASYVDH